MRKRINWTEEQEKIVEKWILVLLAANNFQPIRGRLRLIKELFLIAKTVSSEFEDAVYFYKYSFGPYSSRAAEKMNMLRKNNVTQVKYTKEGWEYRLNESYYKTAQGYLNSLDPDSLDRVELIKSKYQKKSSTQIIIEIYTKYPEYAERSAIAKDIVATQ